MASVRQTISLGVDDLAVTRFAVSSLAETVFALRLLRTGDASPVNLPWLRWARHDLSSRPLSFRCCGRCCSTAAEAGQSS